MIWLYGHDIPTVRSFDAGFAERRGEKAHRETARPGDPIALYAHNMRPFRGSLADRRPADQPLFPYPYVAWRVAFAAMAPSAEITPPSAHALAYPNPADQGSIMPSPTTHFRFFTGGCFTLLGTATDAP